MEWGVAKLLKSWAVYPSDVGGYWIASDFLNKLWRSAQTSVVCHWWMHSPNMWWNWRLLRSCYIQAVKIERCLIRLQPGQRIRNGLRFIWNQTSWEGIIITPRYRTGGKGRRRKWGSSISLIKDRIAPRIIRIRNRVLTERRYWYNFERALPIVEGFVFWEAGCCWRGCAADKSCAVDKAWKGIWWWCEGLAGGWGGDR